MLPRLYRSPHPRVMDWGASVKTLAVSAPRTYARPVDQDELRSVAPDLERQRHPAPAGPAPAIRRDEPEAAVSRLGSAMGNRGLSRAITQMRDGEGILPGGLVHPDVEAAIAAASGRGNQLHTGVAEQVGGAYGQPLGDVRVHHDEHAAALSRAVSARAFTVGTRHLLRGRRVPARRGRRARAARPRAGPRRSAAGGAEHRAADGLATGRHARTRGRGRRPELRLTGTGV